MNKIQAIIRPEKVDEVISALERVGCLGLHVMHVSGRGQQRGVQVFTGRGAETQTSTMLPKAKLETVVPDDRTEPVIAAIIEAARSEDGGKIGDGKIFISPITEAVRVRTGERGEAAI